MKKIIISACISFLATTSAVAQEKTGGSDSLGLAFGEVTGPMIAAGAVVAGVGLGMLSNNRGSGALPEVPGPGPGPGPGPDPQPQCNGDDPLVDGVCIGTTLTNTLTVSGTMTTTITVPVTFTYAPSL